MATNSAVHTLVLLGVFVNIVVHAFLAFALTLAGPIDQIRTSPVPRIRDRTGDVLIRTLCTAITTDHTDLGFQGADAMCQTHGTVEVRQAGTSLMTANSGLDFGGSTVNPSEEAIDVTADPAVHPSRSGLFGNLRVESLVGSTEGFDCLLLPLLFLHSLLFLAEPVSLHTPTLRAHTKLLIEFQPLDNVIAILGGILHHILPGSEVKIQL
jgi:hypothetical protein